jgi:hypothetical protein
MAVFVLQTGLVLVVFIQHLLILEVLEILLEPLAVELLLFLVQAVMELPLKMV